MQPKISVVTVCRNAKDLLMQTVRSVESQDYADLEYIVVDGASSDGSLKVIESCGCVAKWVSEPDKGIYDAMNKGCRMATGDWILFLNAGDTFASADVVARLARDIAENPDVDVVYGDVIRSGDSEELKKASPTLKPHRLAFCHQSVICRRKLLEENPFDISHRYSADFKFFKILEKKGCGFKYAAFPVARFDVSGISTVERSSGLADNIRVIRETDGLVKGLPAIMHLLPTYLISRIRGK